MRGYSGNKDALGKRLARIEGQVRGIAAMLGNDLMRAIARQDELEDIIGSVSQTYLGLTANCAR